MLVLTMLKDYLHQHFGFFVDFIYSFLHLLLFYFTFFTNLRLVSLQFLSVDHNELLSVPTEICHLINLTELHLADNQISRYIIYHLCFWF